MHERVKKNEKLIIVSVKSYYFCYTDLIYINSSANPPSSDNNNMALWKNMKSVVFVVLPACKERKKNNGRFCKILLPVLFWSDPLPLISIKLSANPPSSDNKIKTMCHRIKLNKKIKIFCYNDLIRLRLLCNLSEFF